MTVDNIGTIETAKNVKAGCGIRYDPEQLGEDCGFDFSAAKDFVETTDSEETTDSAENQSNEPHPNTALKLQSKLKTS
jgi:hypothetical protein